ncbi:MAG: hypothetical protein P8P73_10690 [Flavobacteriaceae bacterium]|nr:hypothetical protein [Bacteroidota bacterium]MDC3326506.1 hypothetical protein [Flavobacteriaceae bacterium]MDG1380459.1 hypothetical protein [Flavobacteriaceae bacterium]MDG2350971.1 hypothetical protein [Flavobacteriaceae bacterium]|tara:strand:- start:6322 stop:7377 length:1056 start_codon:yes stop_codon:yes gene_type:complete
MINKSLKPGTTLSAKSIRYWRTVQLIFFLIGLCILLCLIFLPELGIHLFWNILIPIAPLLLVVATGLWRNICPMGTTSLIPRHLNVSQRKSLDAEQLSKLNFIAIVGLFIIVPLRHAIFNTNGLATAILLSSLVFIAISVGLKYEWKSAWCSGLCPVHPVEKLYGLKNKLKLPNAHCKTCHKCITPCPDKTPGLHPLTNKKSFLNKLSGLLLVAAFPGFVWGWFQVKDYESILSPQILLDVYGLPFLGMLFTILFYIILKPYVRKDLLISLFSFLAIAFYYWYRIPALFGFGIFPGDGMLVNLTQFVPEWVITSISTSLIIFLFWWIVLSKKSKISWLLRPAYEVKTSFLK